MSRSLSIHSSKDVIYESKDKKKKCKSEKKSTKCKEVIVCPPSSICSLPTPVTSPVLPLSGTTFSTTVLVPISVTVPGIGGNPTGISFPSADTVVLTTVIGGVVNTTTITCSGGVATATVTTVLGPLPAGVNLPVTITGLPIVGAVADSITSTPPVASGVTIPISSASCGTLLVQGLLNQTVSFTGVSAATPELATAIATFLLTQFTAANPLSALLACLTTSGLTVATFLAQIAAIFTALGLAPPPIATDTIATLLPLILASPAVIAALAASILPILSSQLLSIPLTKDFGSGFPFTVPISSQFLIPECKSFAVQSQNVTVTGTVLLITPAPLATSTIPAISLVTITGSLSGATAVEFADLLAALGIPVVPTILTAPFTVTVAPGLSIDLVPAITKTDSLTACISLTPVTSSGVVF